MRRIFLTVLELLLIAAPAFAGGGPSETVVLVNESSADSKRVAEHYVAARGIPPTQVCRVDCATELTVDILDFVRDVADPLRDFLRERGLEDRCRFVVMTQGMPIRAKTPGGFVSTAAALTLLDTPVCGARQARTPALPNPLRPDASHPMLDGRRAYMVTALISTTADEAIALVDRSVTSDGTAPKSALFTYQDAAGAARRRNATYDNARMKIESLGHRTEHVVHGPKEVNDRKRVMGYMSGGSYSKLTVAGVGTNEYLPGAICDMLQSFGAVPENFAPGAKTRQFPVTHMIRAGVTGVHGAVAEPYDIAFPGADLFRPYVEGYTLAETFYRHVPYGYWMNLVLGDPLCAPYGKRPDIWVAPNAHADSWTGKMVLGVSVPASVRTSVFVDGEHVASLEVAQKGTLEVDTAAFPDGKHHVLIESVGSDAAKTRGWRVRVVEFANGRAAADPIPVAAGPAALRVEAPDTVEAGKSATVRVTALDAAGEPLGGWTGRVEVRSADPPVRWAAADAEAGVLELPLTIVRAGTLHLSARAPDRGLTEAFELRVDPAAPQHATTPLRNFPTGQAMDMEVHVLDRFGNRTPWEGTLRLELPGDAHGTLPEPVTLTRADRGRAVFRDVLVTQTGRCQLVFKDGKGRVWSAAGEGVTAANAGLRAWLFGRPASGKDAATLFSGAAPGKGADVDGAVAPTGLFRRHRDGNDEIDLPASGTRDGDTVVAVAHVEALSATEVRVTAAAPGRLRILVDGKQVHDGVPKNAAPRGKRAQVAELKLPRGRHRVTVVVERKGRFSFALGLEDAKGNLPGTLRVRPASGEDVATLSVSGRVRLPGGRGVPSAVVTIGARTTKTDRDGHWWLSGFDDGPLTVTCSHEKQEPRGRAVELDGKHAVDVDFVLPDAIPPTVKLPGLAAQARFGRRLRLAPQVGDADVVRSVRLLVDGKQTGAALTRSPWRLDVDLSALPRGAHQIVVAATDASGNSGESDPVTVTLIDDTAGPKVTFRGLSKNGLLRKKVTVTAKATDELGVATVVFELAGERLGGERTQAPFTVELDPAALAAGRHELICIARDPDGNETRATLPFRSK